MRACRFFHGFNSLQVGFDVRVQTLFQCADIVLRKSQASVKLSNARERAGERFLTAVLTLGHVEAYKLCCMSSATVFKVALIVHLSLRTAPLQRLVLFDRTPSLAYAPPAHLCTLRRAESRCSRAPEYTAPCRESLLADRAASAAVSRVAVRASTRHPCGPC